MKLVTFADADGIRPALLDGAQVIALPEGAPRGPSGLVALIADWSAWDARLRALLTDTNASRRDLASGRCLAPLHYPGKLLMAGSNYMDHAREMALREGRELTRPPEPFLFVLPTRHTIVGPDDPVRVPAWAQKLDWEVELAVVIGRETTDCSVEEAMDAVFGYTILNDVSSRSGNMRSEGPFKHDWLSGKGRDSFCPMGPCVVTKDELTLPRALTLHVNDELMQNGTTADLTFNVPELVAYASTRVTLDPGDVISTGTPSGVGAGRGIFLKNGDVMKAAIDGIGELTNAVIA